MATKEDLDLFQTLLDQSEELKEVFGSSAYTEQNKALAAKYLPAIKSLIELKGIKIELIKEKPTQISELISGFIAKSKVAPIKESSNTLSDETKKVAIEKEETEQNGFQVLTKIISLSQKIADGRPDSKSDQQRATSPSEKLELNPRFQD